MLTQLRGSMSLDKSHPPDSEDVACCAKDCYTTGDCFPMGTVVEIKESLPDEYGRDMKCPWYALFCREIKWIHVNFDESHPPDGQGTVICASFEDPVGTVVGIKESLLALVENCQKTPLHTAASRGKVSVCKYLVSECPSLLPLPVLSVF